MRTLLVILSQAILLTLAALWYHQNPGTFHVTWLGYDIQGSLGLLFVGGFLITLGLLLALRFLRAIIQFPLRLRQRYSAFTHRRFLIDVEDSLMAYLSQDSILLKQTSASLAHSDPTNPLTLFFQGHAAFLSDDETTATKYFQQLASSSTHGFLGSYGLLLMAQRNGHIDQAIDHVTACLEFNKNAKELRRLRLDLYLKKEWHTQALEEIALLLKKNPADPQILLHKKIALYRVALKLHHQQPHQTRILSYLEEALNIDPTDLDILDLYGTILRALGRGKSLASALEKAWAVHPQAPLLDRYLALYPDASPIERYKYIQKLTKLNPTHRESTLALARCALAAKLWGAAHDALKPLLSTPPYDPEANDLLKQIEKSDSPLR